MREVRTLCMALIRAEGLLKDSAEDFSTVQQVTGETNKQPEKSPRPWRLQAGWAERREGACGSLPDEALFDLDVPKHGVRSNKTRCLL